MLAAILNGHDSHATYRRHCPGCLERTIHTANGDRIQYYHRHVTLQLVGPEMCLLLDAEALCPGEGETAAALCAPLREADALLTSRCVLRGTLRPTKRGRRYAPNPRFSPKIAHANLLILEILSKLVPAHHYQVKLRNRWRHQGGLAKALARR